MDILVSVIIITYNSSQFVLETLDSIKKQTYNNIEMIVTDDCSTDNTLQIVKDWVDQNKNCFISVCVIECDKNTGISANCNRGLRKAKGKYVKFIAGDDLLMPNCIQDNVMFAEKKEIEFLFSKCIVFNSEDAEKKELKEYSEIQDKNRSLFEKEASKQYYQLLRGCTVYAPGNFMHREKLLYFEGFDERFKIEDYPLWLKITKAGVKLNFLNKATVLYRVNNHNSVSHHSEKRVMSEFYLDQTLKIYRGLRRAYLPILERLDEDLNFYILSTLVKGDNSRRQQMRLRYIKILSPIAIVKRIKRILNLWKVLMPSAFKKSNIKYGE